jgi:cytidylate kinase
MKTQLHDEPRIVAEAENRMRAWVRSGEITDRMLSSRGTVAADRGLGPFVTISREHGALGCLIAELVGQKLGWEVLDKSLLDRISQRYRLSRPMLDLVDETSSNWVHDILGTWLDPHIIPHEKYLTHLRHVVMAAAQRGRLVLVGRGAQFLLPREHGVAARLIASEPFRVAQIAHDDGISAKEAYRVMKAVDLGRANFVARYFHQDIHDPHLYDLVIHVERCGPAAAAEMIVKRCSDL